MTGTEKYTNGTSKYPFSDRLRLIRFRMDREKLKFSQEIRLIPKKLPWFVAAAYLIAMVVAQVIHYFEGPAWPELSTEMNRLALAGLVTLGSIFVAGLVFWIGYVNRDARRRGMNSTLWTLLVIALLPAYLVIGFVIYYFLREPLPYNCPNCSGTVSARFNYCPACQCNLRPACPQCRHEVRLTDRYCPNCANELASSTANLSAEG